MLQPSEEVAVCPVADVNKVNKLTRVVERLAEQVERLQQETHSRRRELVPTPLRPFNGECWRCHQRGHMARNCSQSRAHQHRDHPPQQGN